MDFDSIWIIIMASLAISSPNLVRLRKDGQWSRLRMAVLSPETVYTARVNQTFTTNDGVAQITYDGGSGTLANVKVGMEMWIGSSAGLSDIGWCRIRKTPTSTIFYIDEGSEIELADNLFLTVIKDFPLTRKLVFVDTNGVAYMDFDTVFSDQYASLNPVPVLGSDAVARLDSNGLASVPFDSSNSFCIGSSISSYAWVCSTAASITGSTTSTPTINLNSAGWHLVECTVTAANAKTKVGYRWIYAYLRSSPGITAFRLDELANDIDQGDWMAKVTLFDEATLSEIRDRAKVIIWSEDFYGTEEISLGPVSGRENVLMSGWIALETIVQALEGRAGEVQFEIHGPAYWLSKIPSFPIGVEHTTAAATAWTNFQSLTVRIAMWILLEWYTTATAIIDISLTSDTRELPELRSGPSMLWEQIVLNAVETILAFPRVDRYSKLYIDIDPQYVLEADRSSFPTVMDLTSQDWQEQIQGSRATVSRQGHHSQSGVNFDGGVTTTIFSDSPGHTPKKYGSWGGKDRLLLPSDQDEANEIAGLWMGRENNEYPSLTIKLPSNNRFLDHAPAMYIRHTVATGDTVRNDTYTNKKFIPRRIRYIHDPVTLAMTCEIEVEGETFPELAVTGDQPNSPPDLPLTPITPSIPVITVPGLRADANEYWFGMMNTLGLPLRIGSTGDMFAGGQATYNAHSVPDSLVTGDGFGWFDIAPDGSAMYLRGTTSEQKIWKATPNTQIGSPVWTEILGIGDAAAGSTIDIIGMPLCVGSKLIVINRLASGGNNKIYSEYNGSTWTHTVITATAQDTRNLMRLLRAYGIVGSGTLTVYTTPTTSIRTANSDTDSRNGWQNLNGGARYTPRLEAGTNRLYNITADADVVAGLNGTIPNEIYPRGCHKGNAVFFVDDNAANVGHGYVSVDGVTFVDKDTWEPGIIESANTKTALTLVWARKRFESSQEQIRLSVDTGASWAAQTGNLWTDSIAIDLARLMNARCVFRRVSNG